MTAEEDKLAEAYEKELRQQQELEINRIMSQQAATAMSPSLMGGVRKENLVEWELSVNDLTDDIKRLLGSEIEIEDENGNRKWVKNPVPNEPFLNDDGVRDILYTIHSLINRNTILSNYKIEEITQRVRMISHELRTLIYCNYDVYGMATGTDAQIERKMNHYSQIILDLDCMIDSCYRRALGGEAHRGLNEQRLVTQSQALDQNNNPYGGFGSAPQQTQQNKPKGISRVFPWNWSAL